MEAPRLVLPHLALNATLDEEGGGGSALRIGVRLTGAARQRVTAALDVVLPPAGAADAGTDADEARWAPADPSQLWLEPASLSWASSEGPSTKYVWLRSASELPLAWVLQDAAAAAGGSESAGQPPDEQGSQPLLRVRLVNATGAAIAQPPQNATTLVAAAADEGDEPDAGGAGDAGDASLPLFGFVANQVAYPPVADGSGNATARIPVRLLAGVLTETATVRFSLVQLPPPGARQGRRQALARQFLPTRATHGFLYFKPPSVGEAAAAEVQQEQQQQWIELPLAWDRIPPEAELRLGERPAAAAAAEGCWPCQLPCCPLVVAVQ